MNDNAQHPNETPVPDGAYRINLQAWTESDGHSLRVTTSVEHRKDGESPERVVMEKLLDLEDAAIRSGLEAMGWKAPHPAVEALSKIAQQPPTLEASPTMRDALVAQGWVPPGDVQSVWLTKDGKAFGSVSDEQIEAVLRGALLDVQQRSGMADKGDPVAVVLRDLQNWVAKYQATKCLGSHEWNVLELVDDRLHDLLTLHEGGSAPSDKGAPFSIADRIRAAASFGPARSIGDVPLLLVTLQEIRRALQNANDAFGGPICDTIWVNGSTTLFDYIDGALEDFGVDLDPPMTAEDAQASLPLVPVKHPHGQECVYCQHRSNASVGTPCETCSTDPDVGKSNFVAFKPLPLDTRLKD